jgi:hypothetical protein
VSQVTDTLNERSDVTVRLAIEMLHMQPVSVKRFVVYEPLVVRVRSTSTIEVGSLSYSVPSCLISQLVKTLPRLHRLASESGPMR